MNYCAHRAFQVTELLYHYMDKYQDYKTEYEKITKNLADPAVINDPHKLAVISKRHTELTTIINLINSIEESEKSINDNQELLKTETDEEMIQMAQTENEELEKKLTELNKELQEIINPADPNNKKDVIMEIRAGTGGDESALFAADLFRMYSRYAENNGWKINILDSNRIGIGGFKEIIFEVNGTNVYKHLKYEAGTHRVQRVPETEKQGRVHTSAATVAVMPQAEEVDVEITDADLRIDIYSASGPGGQSVNTSNSAVRITHLPTGAVAQCQDQKSQQQNKVKAMEVLRSRIYQKLEEEKQKKEAAQRKSQIGSGDRSEKIRTYNYPQDRITDHRIKKNWSNMNTILDGGLDDVINSLQEEEAKLFAD